MEVTLKSLAHSGGESRRRYCLIPRVRAFLVGIVVIAILGYTLEQSKSAVCLNETRGVRPGDGGLLMLLIDEEV